MTCEDLIERLRDIAQANRLEWPETVVNEAADELERLRAAFPYCEKHAPKGGTRSGCLKCAYIELSAAMSRISYLCGEPNDMQYSTYDADYDAKAVVAQVERLRAERDALRADADRAVGKTALRCIEMAMWPKGVDDEQAYYGRMFAEFIEKEFKGAIDAAMRGKEQGNANPDR